MIEGAEVYFSRLARLEKMVKLSSELVKTLETEIAIFRGDVERSPTPIEKLDLNSMRSWNVLKAAKIKTVEQLTMLRAEDILSFKLAGRKTLRDIQGALAEFGLTLSI